MDAIRAGTAFLALFALAALLGCVQEETVFCTEDAKECPDGSFVSRNPANNCEFHACTEATGNRGQQAEELVIGPEYYVSEEEAFTALGSELEGIEDLSNQELESLLGQ